MGAVLLRPLPWKCRAPGCLLWDALHAFCAEGALPQTPASEVGSHEERSAYFISASFCKRRLSSDFVPEFLAVPGV